MTSPIRILRMTKLKYMLIAGTNGDWFLYTSSLAFHPFSNVSHPIKMFDEAC